MKRNKLISGILSVLVAVWLVLGIIGCNSGSLPVPPPPQTTDLIPTTMVTETTPPSETTAIITPPPESIPSSIPAETGINVDSNLATVDFPDKITFSLEGTSPVTIKTIALEHGTDQRSLTVETTRNEIDFEEGKEINVSWDWEMKKTGSIPPGSTVWWKWVLTDADGKTITVPRKELFYTDTRFSWQMKELTDMNIYWHGDNEALVNTLADEVQERLLLVKLNVTFPPERKPKVFVYTSSEELRGAILFEQEWTGALAYPGYNIVLTAVNTNNLEWAKAALPHEITHLMTGELIFGPFGDIPLWLNEGLSEYAEGPMPDYYKQILDAAVKDNSLISIKSLSSGFPTSSSGASLAYAQSNSIVRYLIDTYGWEKIRQLLAVFKEGSTYDKGLMTVYSFDMDGLDAEWRASLK